jgi:hypothetical protein
VNENNTAAAATLTLGEGIQTWVKENTPVDVALAGKSCWVRKCHVRQSHIIYSVFPAGKYRHGSARRRISRTVAAGPHRPGLAGVNSERLRASDFRCSTYAKPLRSCSIHRQDFAERSKKEARIFADARDARGGFGLCVPAVHARHTVRIALLWLRVKHF